MAGLETTQKFKRRLPPFLDHSSPRELKTLFRCWVAAWVACILMFIQPVLSDFGADVFFACVVLFIIPPSGGLFEYILGAISIFVGICLAWAWGVITLKAALAARPDAQTQALLMSMQEAISIQAQNTGESPSIISQRLIFDGWMLDTRVTVIIYCMLCPFVYFMARLRADNPKATLTFVFATIITGSFLCFGPLFPSFNGTLPLPLVKPAAVGVGLGLACTILFFPQSAVGITLEGISDVIEDLKPLLPSFTNPDIEYLGKCQAKVVNTYQKLEPSFAFLPLDFSIGCWGADVVQAFHEPIQKLVIAVLALSDFHRSGIQSDTQIKELRAQLVDSGDGQSYEKKTDDKSAREVGAHQRAQFAAIVNALYEEDSSFFDELAPKLRETALAAVEGCLEGLTVIQESLQFVGRQHWYHTASSTEHDQVSQRIQIVLINLRESRITFLQHMAERLEENYGPSLGGDEGPKHNLSGVIIAIGFQEHMVNVLTSMELLLQQVSKHFSIASRVQPWWPTSIKYAVTWALEKHAKAPTMRSGATSGTPDQPKQTRAIITATQEGKKVLQARHGYRPRARHPIGKAVIGLYHWLTCNAGLYALRMVIITITVSITAVLPSTAGFFYREKGLWALITAQLGLGIDMPDFTFSTFGPAAGTLAGGILGLLGWYIGSGGGPGNPYGLSAVCAAFLPILLWVRLYVPPYHIPGGTLVAVTFLLVIIYSYVDTHNPTYGDPGVGYNVFWRRVLLILIGSGAATIVQILPRPPSATRHVCKSLSRSVRTLSDYYALLLSSWSEPNPDQCAQALGEPIWMGLTQSLNTLADPISNLRFELSSSRFDSTSLKQIKQICHVINNNLASLLKASATLPRPHRDQLVHMSGMLDQRCIGEIMAVLGIAEQAIRTGDAPPEMLPTPLVRRALEFQFGRSRQSHNRQTGCGGNVLVSAEMLKDKDYCQLCVALAAYIRFLAAVDELVLLIKGVLGEAHLVAEALADLV
ncbi:hypothetical protein BJX68DRAFT_277643 [Aspergillus pseudodeflectus]|uniref:ER transporter 6TM N-terminal domain-containing protein n=1 Tax=Aspergillus pseudodeflectus TaxID=176178 RepID=A0ABR4L366_9EURO